MHETVTFDNVWIAIIGAFILFVSLFFISPKLIRFLDAWINRENEEIEKSKKNKEGNG